MTRVLFLCNDALGENMAGPGIRYWELARVLGQTPGLQVTLAVLPMAPDPAVRDADTFPAQIMRCRDEADVRAVVATAEVVLCQGIVLAPYPFLADLQVPLILDALNPTLLERLYVDTDTASATHLLAHESYLRVIQWQMRAADFIMCGSEKQRDYWLGVMSAVGRVNPYTHADDPTLRRLIDVVPFGLPSEPPRHTRQVLKGVYAGIDAEDKVLLWLSGIWNWLDAPTVIRAMACIVERRPNVKLFFMGVKRPNIQSDKWQADAQAITLSQELGLRDRWVFFKDWVPYAERANYLLEADVGVSMHCEHLEARFAFRTRFLDFMWAGLPIVATQGDVLSEQVKMCGLGRVVRPGDVDGVAVAIQSLLETPNLRETLRPRFEQVAMGYQWESVARPLVAFCLSPRLAPDKAYLHASRWQGFGPTPWWQLPGKAWRVMRLGGVRALARQTQEYGRWLSARRGEKRVEGKL